MLDLQFDIRKMQDVKDLVIRLRDGEKEPVILDALQAIFTLEENIALLLVTQALLDGDYGITMHDLQEFMELYTLVYEYPNGDQLGREHPLQLLKLENRLFEVEVKQIDAILEEYAHQEVKLADTIGKLQKHVHKLGEFRRHYDRKEKIYFPLLERHGHFSPGRIMWRKDERIAALYKGVKRLVDEFPETEMTRFKQIYHPFKDEFMHMIYHEEKILLPLLLALFTEAEWKEIQVESVAYGYSMEEELGENTSMLTTVSDRANVDYDKYYKGDIPFGSGYLRLEEVNEIFNNLPVEITFVDRHSMFKYFNNVTESFDMMFIRTPVSIGRNVANCHPPKSLSKVMRLIRDLKAKKRESETMWFKKGDQYIHITYKGLFNKDDEFLGILEYVQDVQAFLELPTDVKLGLSEIVK